jgi:hypothetical protein
MVAAGGLTYPRVRGEGNAVAAWSRRASRDTALIELQRLHAAILASKMRRGALPPGLAVPSTQARSEAQPVGSPSPETLAARELTRRLQAGAVDDVDIPAETAKSRKVLWLLAAAAVLVVGAWVTLTVLRRPEVVTEAAQPIPGPHIFPKPADPAGSAGPAAGSASPAAAPTTSPAAPATPAAAPATPAVPARAVRVALTTIRPVWMRVMVDGARAIEREVAAGERLTFEGDQRVVVRVGDAGGVTATFNGEDRGALGRGAVPVTVSFPNDPPAAAVPRPEAAPAPPADPTSRPPG